MANVKCLLKIQGDITGFHINNINRIIIIQIGIIIHVQNTQDENGTMN